MYREWFKNVPVKYQHFLLLLTGSGILYSELMINQLTNDYDGLWENSFHNAGAWEISLGRWFWQYISRARFGTSSDPYTTLITLAIMAAGLLLLFDLWHVSGRYIIFLSGMLFLSNAAICFELSYRYMSPTFGAAFLLSIMSVWCFKKIDRTVVSILAGSLCIAFSMGSYQAYICCTTVAFLTALLIDLSRNTDWESIARFSARSIAGILLGGFEYIAILNIYLRKHNLEMSVYQGADSYSIANSLQCLPTSIYKAYQIFVLYFKGILFKINRMQGKHIFAFLFILLLIRMIFVFWDIYAKSRIKAVLFVLLCFLYPPAALSVLMIATDAVFALQMSCGPALFLSALPCLFCQKNEKPAETDVKSDTQTEDLSPRNNLRKLYKKCRKLFNLIFILFMSAVLYGSIFQVIIDQNTMYEGRIATENVADMVVDRLLQEDLISSEYRYVFVGTPCSSPLYAIDSNYEYANIYALYGAWYSGHNGAKSWRGVIRYRKGLNLNVVSDPEYNILSSSETIADMPQFPKTGSIMLDGDIVYIKIDSTN